MKTTLKDISIKTGLSISTVSRVLRGESNADFDTVALTIQAANELDYPFNSRVLNEKYSYKERLHVALITTMHPDEFYSSFFYGINLAAKEKNINLSFYDFDPTEKEIGEFMHELANNSVDAALLFLPELNESDYVNVREVAPKNFTLLSLAPLINPMLDTITFDSYGGGYVVAEHFHKKGYLDVGIITGPINMHESLFRRNGFIDFVVQQRSMSLAFEFCGDYTFDSGRRAFEAYEASKNKPRAIFASSDDMCLGFVESATKKGIKIPEDIAIAGFDDLPICGKVHPPITSVHTNHKLLGLKAFDVLKEKKASENEPIPNGILNIIPVTLTKRSST